MQIGEELRDVKPGDAIAIAPERLARAQAELAEAEARYRASQKLKGKR